MPKPKISEIADSHMLIHKAFRFRLKPTGAQELFFRKTAGACRFVYNGALFQRQAHYRATGESLCAFGQAKHLTAVKRTEDLASCWAVSMKQEPSEEN